MNNKEETNAGLMAIARALHMLGNADASTPLGGLEALGMVLKESNESIAGSLSEIADAILHVADAIDAHG